jgi:hypothetical protein
VASSVRVTRQQVSHFPPVAHLPAQGKVPANTGQAALLLRAFALLKHYKGYVCPSTNIKTRFSTSQLPSSERLSLYTQQVLDCLLWACTVPGPGTQGNWARSPQALPGVALQDASLSAAWTSLAEKCQNVFTQRPGPRNLLLAGVWLWGQRLPSSLKALGLPWALKANNKQAKYKTKQPSGLKLAIQKQLFPCRFLFFRASGLRPVSPSPVDWSARTQSGAGALTPSPRPRSRKIKDRLAKDKSSVTSA